MGCKCMWAPDGCCETPETGASSNIVKINVVDPENMTFSADKTYSEIEEMLSRGIIPVAWFEVDGVVSIMPFVTNANAMEFQLTAWTGNTVASSYLEISENDEIFFGSTDM